MLGFPHGLYQTPAIPDVKFAGIMHLGLIWCLSSKDLFSEWEKRPPQLTPWDGYQSRTYELTSLVVQ